MDRFGLAEGAEVYIHCVTLHVLWRKPFVLGPGNVEIDKSEYGLSLSINSKIKRWP